MARRIQTLILIGGIVLLAAVVIFLDVPERTRFWQESFTAGHTIVFGLCALAMLRLSMLLWANSVPFRLMHYLIALLAALVIGAATEIIQSYVGRDAELADWIRDLLGALAFLCTAATFDAQLTWDFGGARFVRLAVRFASPILIILIFWPALKWGGSYIYRDAQMPLVADFDSVIMRQFARASNARLAVVDPPNGWQTTGEKVGRVTFFPAVYPGIMFRELSPNWSKYSSLRFGIFSLLKDTVNLELRINDRHHNEKYNDRYNATLKVRPGENAFAIPLERLKKAPATRTMDLADMGTVILFSYKPTDSFSIYLSRLTLQ